MENNLITAFQTNGVSLAVSLAVIGLLYALGRRRLGFGYRVLIALGLGLAAGIFFNSYKFDFKSVSTIGSIYVNLVRMLVIPLVVVLVINSITTLTNPGHLRKIGVKTISIFLRPVSPR